MGNGTQTAGTWGWRRHHCFRDLKHYSVEQWGLKDPPQCDPFWLLNRNVLLGQCSACLYTQESLSMLIGQSTDQRSGTQLPRHIAPCLLLSKTKWYRACGTAEATGSPGIWQESLTCNLCSCMRHTGQGISFADCRLWRGKPPTGSLAHAPFAKSQFIFIYRTWFPWRVY